MDSGGSSEGSDHNTSVIDLTGVNSEDRRSIDRTQDDINISSFDMEGTTVGNQQVAAATPKRTRLCSISSYKT